MCLSSVYKDQEKPENLILANVQRIDIRDGQVFLTDLMERQMAIEGTLEKANLVDGYVIVRESVPA